MFFFPLTFSTISGCLLLHLDLVSVRVLSEFCVFWTGSRLLTLGRFSFTNLSLSNKSLDCINSVSGSEATSCHAKVLLGCKDLLKDPASRILGDLQTFSVGLVGNFFFFLFRRLKVSDGTAIHKYIKSLKKFTNFLDDPVHFIHIMCRCLQRAQHWLNKKAYLVYSSVLRSILALIHMPTIFLFFLTCLKYLFFGRKRGNGHQGWSDGSET